MTRQRVRALLSSVCVCAALAAASGVSATTVVPLSDETLARSADMVVLGVVSDVEVVEYDVGPGIFVEYTIAVRERLDGSVTLDELVVRVPGGRTDTRQMLIPGMPSFELGETLVLFLEPLPADAFGPDAAPAFLPFGLQQGVWRQVDGGWQRGAQHGLLPTDQPPEIRPLSLEQIRELCSATEQEVAPEIPTSTETLDAP